ncbi:MTA/SAH nucleosidase [Alicyclobacillus contaminans]|uniref:HAD family hydrolase n=1 Tax=Alicyclobacillus contaminans TaxID=392016 RepID=UPI0003F5FB8C|nr:HAD family hydrolase [Alicyclobacillus contaminans]GMA49637.1 MTA/SAH nucleosidase [Alicyclobacillus contaminans]
MATIIFDLDGTLIDSTKIVLPAYRQAIRTVAQTPPPNEAVMKRTFGLPDADIWATLLPGATESVRQAAYEYTEQWVGNNLCTVDLLLPHARDVLAELQQRGHTLTTASNCGQAYLDAVLDSQGLRPYFTAPLCLGGVGGQRKADILARHFERFEKNTAVMVGDRATDVEAAQAHGIPCIGCHFVDFGDPTELAGAVCVIHQLTELLDLFPAGQSTLSLHG